MSRIGPWALCISIVTSSRNVRIFLFFFSYCFEISAYPISDFSLLPGMAEAKVTTRGRSMDLDSTIKKAVKNKEIPKARQMIGHLVRWSFSKQFSHLKQSSRVIENVFVHRGSRDKCVFNRVSRCKSQTNQLR